MSAGVKIVKKTSRTDNDAAPGPTVPSQLDGEHGRALVTSTGNLPLTAVTVTDDKVSAITCPKTTLDAGEGAAEIARQQGPRWPAVNQRRLRSPARRRSDPMLTDANPDLLRRAASFIRILKKTNNTNNDAPNVRASRMARS